MMGAGEEEKTTGSEARPLVVGSSTVQGSELASGQRRKIHDLFLSCHFAL